MSCKPKRNEDGWHRGNSYVGYRGSNGFPSYDDVRVQPYENRGNYARQDFGSNSSYGFQPRYWPTPGIDFGRRDPRGLGVDLSPLGPYAGSAGAAAATSVGVPPPAAAWYGNWVSENTRAAGREYTLGDAATRTFTGVSPRDIQERGILGGDNSDARRFCNALFGSC